MKGRGYKCYLKSCKLGDVSPRIRRRSLKKHKENTNSNAEIVETDNVERVSVQDEHMTQNASNRDYLNVDIANLNVPNAPSPTEFERSPTSSTNSIASNIVQNSCINEQRNEVRCLVDEFSPIEENLLDDLRDFNKSRTDISKTTNLQEFIAHNDFLGPISTCVDKSPGEIFLMILEHSVKFRSSFSQMCNMLNLVNNMFAESILPETRYRLDNLLNPKNDVEYHSICPKCCKYVGKIQSFGSLIACDECSEIIDLSNPSSSDIFVLIDPSRSIIQLLEENQSYYEFVVKHRLFNGEIRDIFDGKSYRTFVNKLPIQARQSYVTAIFNTDGAPRFESSNFSIWPIYLQLNEIPVEVRFKRIIPCGIWFGRSKPAMSSFLKPFTEMINKLSSTGISCTINGELKSIKLYCLTSSVDSVARAPMQGIKQFNGKYGCNWCLHEGQFEEGSMRYPVVIPSPEERTTTNMENFMQQLIHDNSRDSVYGVTCISPLINMTYFDIVDGFVPEYMHSCLAGVSKQITCYILNKLSNEKVDQLNEMLLKIKVPHQLHRLTRSFQDVNDWKAKEWQNFTLYYSLPLYHLLQLPNKLISYWKLFVDSLFTLLQQNITINDVDKVDENLHKFVFLTQKYFQKVAMTFNVHLLLHIPKTVLNWGPLWCHSTFPFESANHDMLNAIHCAKGVHLQIVRYINVQQAIKILENAIFPHASQVVINYCKELTVKGIKKSLKLSSVTYLGSQKLIDNRMAQTFGMTESHTFQYERAIIGNCLFASSERKNSRSDNSFAQLSDGTFIRIIYFLVDTVTKEEKTLCRIINTSMSISKFGYKVRSFGSAIIKIDTEKIVNICVYINNDDTSFILTMPNLLHY